MTTHTDHAAAAVPAFDQGALDRLKRFGGAKLLNEMISLFLESAPERIASARSGTQSGDAPTTERALHSLKSSAAQLGAMRLQRLSDRGEQLARGEALSLVMPLVLDLEDEFVRVREWLTNAREETQG